MTLSFLLLNYMYKFKLPIQYNARVLGFSILSFIKDMAKNMIIDVHTGNYIIFVAVKLGYNFSGYHCTIRVSLHVGVGLIGLKRNGPSLNLCRIHVDIWQNQYNIVKLKNKIKVKNKKNKQNRYLYLLFLLMRHISSPHYLVK